ncbi:MULTISPECIES: acyl-CoA reductase [unclassified Frankia]|uniref:acyl-CoA reductase n=1 Tax=unclassified Frankia TaxID=2632575 RepID=UPI0020252352
MPAPLIPAFVRGELRTAGPVESAAGFAAPDPLGLLDTLPLRDPARMAELQSVPLTEIIDLLGEVGARLSVPDNPFLAEALDQLAAYSDLTPALLRSTYRQLPSLFEPGLVRSVAERTVGTRFLDGWADVGAGAVRAFGSRCVHIIAGNNPIIAAITIVRSAITRCDTIIKSPSNDPLTALAIARTIAETAPGHPLTRHLSVVYWKGGDERFERALYHPAQVEKIVAWGGLASVQHVTRYIRPGLELVPLDPKLSATVIGAQAFADAASMAATARLAAADVGVLNQEGCFNARVIYVVTGTGPAGVALANRWGQLLYDAVQALPEQVSTPARRFDPDLRADLRVLRADTDFYRVIGGRADEGAVVVSQLPDPVDFHQTLSGRVANVVPVDDVADAVRAMNAYTQTVGVYPESLKRQLRDTAPLYGAQRLVSLGYATRFRADLPQDAMEPTRRMVKWIVDETYHPELTHPLEHLRPGSGRREADQEAEVAR